MASQTPARNRIIIGDVGSGKTIVGLFIGLGFLNGVNEVDSSAICQVAMVAPTEVIAYQHYLSLTSLIAKNSLQNLVTGLYVSGSKYMINGDVVKKKEFEGFVASCTNHIFWIGTHALLYRNDVLAELVLIDEQHKFGVNQRKELVSRLEKNNKYAHFVSFSATPIPRTVALLTYRDLEPLFLNRLPKKGKTTTVVVTFDELESKVIPALLKSIHMGQKVFVVCSRIEDEEESELWSIKKASEYFEKKVGKVITLHGKNKNKDEILAKFRESQDTHLLIATSVIEVGVDISNATAMVVLNAERFGLAALHQIRGRVGRNSLETNLCFLVTNESGKYSKRLHYISKSEDGFWLAQKDLELRGGGDMTGKLQSGYSEDIDLFITSDPSDSENIQKLVDSLDFTKTELQYPRLHKILESSLNDHWNE